MYREDGLSSEVPQNVSTVPLDAYDRYDTVRCIPYSARERILSGGEV